MKPLKTVSERLQDTLSMVAMPTVRIAVPSSRTNMTTIARMDAKAELLKQYQRDYAHLVRDERMARSKPRRATRASQ